MTTNNIDWNDVIKKEARGNNDEDFGEVQDIQGNYVLVQKGIINKEKFYIPKDQAESYDGDVLKFRFSEQELNQFSVNHHLHGILIALKKLQLMKGKLMKKVYH